MITMKLDKDRIAKIKSNVEVDLEFLQEARQECKSFEPFDYDDNADAFFNTIADDYYQDLHYNQRIGLDDSIKQALGQNFELTDINTASRAGIGYAPVGVMHDVVLRGTYKYIVWLEIPSELNNADRFELIKKMAKVINTELSRFEVRTGATALLSEVCEY